MESLDFIGAAITLIGAVLVLAQKMGRTILGAIFRKPLKRQVIIHGAESGDDIVLEIDDPLSPEELKQLLAKAISDYEQGACQAEEGTK